MTVLLIDLVSVVVTAVVMDSLVEIVMGLVEDMVLVVLVGGCILLVLDLD